MPISVSNKNCSFLVDSGADISLLKTRCISRPISINQNNTCVLRGITPGEATCRGTINCFSYIQNTAVNSLFHLIEDDFPIPTDGILGRDFLTTYRCEINYDTWILAAYVNNIRLEIPICNNLNGSAWIPARSEVFRLINNFNVHGDVIINSAELAPGVFCANAIVNSSAPYAKIINTNEYPVQLANFNLKTSNLNDFYIAKIDCNNTDRIEKLNAELNFNDIPASAKQSLQQLCHEYNDIFSLKDDLLTCNNFYQQKISLKDKSPVYIKNYRNAQCHKEEICRQVDNLIANDIIEPSVSSYNSPLLLVPKKSTTSEKKWRLVVDFRQLNKKLLADKFPLPRIDDILDQLGRAKYFSTLDLMSGFHQIEIEKNSREFTAFSLQERGHFQYKRLPFGLNISPNSFQRMMSIALSGLSPECAFLYIDDVIVVGCSIEHHLKNLRNVFECFRQRNLKLNPSKCNFFKAEVTFLGHKITDKGILPDNSKFDVIKNYPQPQNADQVRSFVAMCNYYRRFIPGFANICCPLNKLLRKNTVFVWSEQCKSAFETLKTMLLSPQILQYPDYQKPFILTTDASDFACGAVLSQMHGSNDLPVSFASRAFTKGEANKHIIEKELAAIHWAIMHYQPYLLGRKFLVRTDHRPLVYLFGMKNPSSKLTRMRIDLEEFDFEVEFVPGKSNVVADALSRINITSDKLKSINILQVQTRSMLRKPCLVNNNIQSRVPEPDQLHVYEAVSNEQIHKQKKLQFSLHQNKNKSTMAILLEKNFKTSLTLALGLTINNVNLPEIFKLIEKGTLQLMKQNKIENECIAISTSDTIFNYISINDFKTIGNQVLKNIKIIIYHPPRKINNPNEIQAILQHYHSTPIGGHVGINRLYKKLKNLYIWSNMKYLVTKYVKSCEICKRNKHFSSVQSKMIKTSTPCKSFDIVAIDTIGPFTMSSKGNRYAVTIQCDLSKYVIAIPVPDKSADTIARAVVEGCILIYGPMKAIRTDQGTEYKGIFESVCKLLNIDRILATAYHPQTLGALERNHRCLNEYLRIFVNDLKDNWDEWLSFYCFSYNTTPNSEHNYSPFEIVFGKPVNTFDQINLDQITPIYNHDSYVNEIRYKLQFIHNEILRKIENVKLSRTEEANKDVTPTKLSIGDKVYLKLENRRKLDIVQDGPYIIIDLDESNATIKHQTTANILKVHRTRLIKQKS